MDSLSCLGLELSVPRVRRATCAATAMLALGACTATLLVKPDDETHARALEHFARTERELADAGVPDSERLLFLQAEAMYRYRFEPPRRSAGTVLASVAAVAIELPALQSVAGAFDLFELRMRAADGAVQLWEPLLERHPAAPPSAPHRASRCASRGRAGRSRTRRRRRPRRVDLAGGSAHVRGRHEALKRVRSASYVGAVATSALCH